MRYEIIFSRRAIEHRKRLDAPTRVEVEDAIVRYLRFEPTRISKSRIKRLRGLGSPQYRLRAGETRIFYDVLEREVQILAIVAKSDAGRWLVTFGEPS